MHPCRSGRQAKIKANISCVKSKSNPASATPKVWGESEYLDLENEDKHKQYICMYMHKEVNPFVSYGELFRDPKKLLLF